ncbi:MAG: hypothetical protein IJB17_05795 [Oscillospiraceae bacterium]|nr:hypothetical protein [Oscillospiraceae bacterium]MBQ7001101.1 hypothetical protein [Oscillospiraceae bacterium]
MRRLGCALLCLALCLSGCGGTQPQETKGEDISQIQQTAAPESGELVLLYTNDIFGAYAPSAAGSLGCAAVAGYRKMLEDAGKTVVLLDGGDVFDGSAQADADAVAAVGEMLETAGYDFAVPGDRDLTLGLDTLASGALNYVCCTLMDGASGNTVFPGYRLEQYGDTTVAFVGITIPAKGVSGFETDGEKFYQQIQSAIDSARLEGAEYVIALGHTGMEPGDTPYTTAEIIANTAGVTVYLDGHSNSVFCGEKLWDSEDKKVPVFANPEGLSSFMAVTLELDSGNVTGQRITAWEEADATTRTAVEELTDG